MPSTLLTRWISSLGGNVIVVAIRSLRDLPRIDKTIWLSVNAPSVRVPVSRRGSIIARRKHGAANSTEGQGAVAN